ncbi:non-ribosomal peptide synthetase, partial [Amycolatopsis circi]|uniref:non-ribosomal peptide synthetase n=1 Tax=Amycolatopsis circi TaxID=871959 RepID=UPI000E228BD9
QTGTVDLPAEVVAHAQQRDWPLDAVFAAAWQALLVRMAGGVVRIAPAAANRPHAEMRHAVGSYVQWLPHATAVDPAQTFAESVAAVADQTRKLTENQEFFDAATFGETPAARAGFAWTDLSTQSDWRVAFAVAHREPFPVLLDGMRCGTTIRLALHHDTARLTTDDARRLAEMYGCLLAAAVREPAARVGSLPMSPSEESRRALAAGLPAAPAADPDRCVHTMFEEQAALRPDQTAVVAGEDRLTYRQLNEQANRIAHCLRRAGVQPEDRVGLAAARGTGLLAGLLGVLKSGAAYLPVDADLPAARRDALFEQAGVRLVLAEGGAGTIDLADPSLADEPVTDPVGGAGLANLAYVIFTSGSTGTPKGVAVTHDSLARYTSGIAGVLDLPAGSGYGIVSTFAADLGHTVVYPSLCTGGTLHVLSREVANSPARMADYADRNPVDCLKIVPSHLRALLDGPRPAAVLPKRRLVLGGEALAADLVRSVRELAPDCRLLNHYGPTETTVGVLSHEVAAADDPVPLGRPLPHARVHVLDDRLDLAPLWTVGEVCVGGPAVARGYLGSPAATAERFVPDPHRPGERLYRTGDLARRRADGTLVFLGRNDEQVKLRGYRVEPAEVAAVLRRHPGVQDATVVVRTGDGSPHLVGYVVADANPEVLQAHCAAHLPSYLVPSAIVPIDAIPLTANGKLDRAALPEPASAAAYAPPESPAEETLAAIWAELLRVDRVGRHDGFFALGGDSILGIQVVSRANQAGLAVTPPLLFQHPTIAALAAACATGAAPVEAEQGPVTGPVPATPIQRWFLGLNLPDPSHYNQTICLRPRETLRVEPLRTALHALVSHHDALRLRLVRAADGGGWTLDNAPIAEHELLRTADDLEPAVVQAQEDIDIASGCLLRAVLAGDHDAQRLVLVAHHLGVDGVSWRILLEDLATAYQQAAAGHPVRLPAKTTSYQDWAVRTAERAHAYDPEIPYWTDLLTAARNTRIPQDEYHADGPGTYGESRTVAVELDASATEALLARSAQTSVHAAVLGALGRVLRKWTGQPVVVDVEGHGRDARGTDVDLSRTAGWFTTIHPVRLSADGAAPAPSGGVGYGILRHLRSDTATARLRALPSPAIRVNYLGRGTGSAGGAGLLELVPDRLGSPADPAARRPYLLDITAVELAGRLRMTWAYRPAAHREQTVAALAGDCLRELAADPGAGARAEPEPGFAESGLADADLAELMDELDTLPAEGDA